MAENGEKTSLPPTLSLVFDDLSDKLSKNSDIDEKIVQKLDDLLRSGEFPGPDDLYTALFSPPKSSDSGGGE